MSGVDVLAVMQRCHNHANITARRHGGPFLRQHEMDVSEARAAVAELIEAVESYAEAEERLANREYHGINAEPHEKLQARVHAARRELEAALRRVKGESE